MSKDYKKLYEDVVALAKDGLSDGLYLSRSAKDVTEFLFPQLKKSENEKISKKLIQLLQNGGRLPDEEHKQALSWLEKQGKIKLTHYDSAEKEKSDFVSGQFIQCRRSFNEFKENESYLLEYIGDDTYIGKSDNVLDEEFYITPRQLFTLFTHEHCPRTDSECEKKDEDNMKDKIIESLQRYMPTDELSEEQEMIAWLEKQNEQKPIDMIEPKFKVGDWITNGKLLVGQVTSFDGEYYHYMCEGIEQPLHISNAYNWHLWTIQDAKDGDALTLNNEYFLFKEKKNSTTECYISHCFIDSAKTFRENGEFLPIERGNKVCPTTKEQYDLLFSKMKEAGYEWDFEKKELKKIEQESTWNEENEGIRKELTEFLKKASGGFLDTTTHCKTFGKWLAWLEKQGGKVDVLDDFPTEFERQISHLIASSINNEWEYKKDFVKHTANALLQYAKNELEKQGEQKIALGEYDLAMIDNLVTDENCPLDSEYISWLKSLKDRFQLQPKQEWSEADEKMFDEVCSSIKYAEKHRITCPEKLAKLQLDWLKSLKSNHWKPSEEQIGALNYAYCELFKRGENGEGSNCVHPLMTLIDDLKKL